MSKEGQIRRGNKWYNMRDIDGNLPEWFDTQVSITDDIKIYLDSIKTEDTIKVGRATGKSKIIKPTEKK